MSKYEEKKQEVAQNAIAYIQGKKGWPWVRDSFNEACEACGANVRSIDGDEGIKDKRKIVAGAIVIDCIYALDRSQLDKLEGELKQEAERLPQDVHRGLHR